jgi:aspartyl-tRNA(Asn)/glutamyl-tRNA(Gln) amidotransferase subunit A
VDAARKAGVPFGPLGGVPVSVKDLYGVCGCPTFAGTVKRLPPEWEHEGFLVHTLRE